MRNFGFNHSIRHMFLTVGAFVVAILFLEADGLENWANRLEPGPLRTVAQPAALALNRTLQPFGVAGVRDRVLDQAAYMGWSDDAVREARVRPSPTNQADTFQPRTSHASAAPPLALRPESKSALTAAASAPIVGSVPRSVSLTPLAPVEQGRQRVVVLAGDSMMAVGFGAGLMRKASEDKNLRILRAFKSGTGLARPDVFNWLDQYPAMVGSEEPEVVIVAMGANDGQSFIADGKVLLFGSEEWRKTYQSRVADFLATVESTGARVLWVGLPPMRSVTFDQRISIVNRIAYTVVSQDPKASWWGTASFVGDASGSFREFAELPDGSRVRLRAPDGIHFTEEGASTMTGILLKWLDPSLERAEGDSKPPPAAPSAPLNETEHSPERTTVAIAHPEPSRRY
jgi:uncharacterized protein